MTRTNTGLHFRRVRLSEVAATIYKEWRAGEYRIVWSTAYGAPAVYKALVVCGTATRFVEGRPTHHRTFAEAAAACESHALGGTDAARELYRSRENKRRDRNERARVRRHLRGAV